MTVHEPTIGDGNRALAQAVSDLGLGPLSVNLVSAKVELLRRHRRELIASLSAPDVAPTASMLRVRVETRREIDICERGLSEAGVPFEEENDDD